MSTIGGSTVQVPRCPLYRSQGVHNRGGGPLYWSQGVHNRGGVHSTGPKVSARRGGGGGVHCTGPKVSTIGGSTVLEGDFCSPTFLLYNPTSLESDHLMRYGIFFKFPFTVELERPR